MIGNLKNADYFCVVPEDDFEFIDFGVDTFAEQFSGGLVDEENASINYPEGPLLDDLSPGESFQVVDVPGEYLLGLTSSASIESSYWAYYEEYDDDTRVL